jgi:glycine/D-amino acid oxidase-like deaminating enzyme/nitrite reductase/ring-hydroxylating ferredoxin subunit
MRADSGTSNSPWRSIQADFEPLLENIVADVCIIGAGIAGISCAYQLNRRGKSVVVLDDGEIAGGETGRTTAHLTNAIDDRYYEIERMHGVQGSRIAAESHAQAIDVIESVVREENIDCNFVRVDGFLFNPPGENPENLTKECESAQRAGVAGVSLVDRAPIPNFDTGPALRFANQAQFDPTQYLQALVEILSTRGARFFTRTHASEVKGGSPAEVTTRDGNKVIAGAVIVATNTPFNDWVVIHTKQAAYRTYAIAATIPAEALPRALFWDTANPYHYVRRQAHPTQPGVELLLIGGEDHKTGQDDEPAERYGRLEEWGRQRFPEMGAVEFCWSGQVMEPVDGVAFIGPNPTEEKNVYIVTGDSGMGMTHGTISSILLTSLIMGRPHPWLKLYDPARKSLRSVGRFLKENLNVAWQYTDWLSGGEVESISEIQPGEGAICQRGLGKVAVYRDPAGNYFSCSAACPHLGAVVSWNSAEKTWDCPAHGSRFDPYGRVLNGPAERNLSAVHWELKNGGKNEAQNKTSSAGEPRDHERGLGGRHNHH